MEYEGRAQLGDGDRSLTLLIRIPDAENPEWFAYVLEDIELPRGEHAVTLLDNDLYSAWHGSALTRERVKASTMLLGIGPLEPPLGA